MEGARRRLVDQEEFLDACADGHLEAARLYQGDVNYVVAGEMTGLTTAASKGRNEMVEMLVREMGARVDLRDGCGRVALHCAVDRRKQHTVRLLMKDLGADPNALTMEINIEGDFYSGLTDRDHHPGGKSPLELAATAPGMIALLIEVGGARVNRTEGILMGQDMGALGRGVFGPNQTLSPPKYAQWCRSGWQVGEEADITRPPWSLFGVAEEWLAVRAPPLPKGFFDSD